MMSDVWIPVFITVCLFFGILIFLDNASDSSARPERKQQLQQQSYPLYIMRCTKAAAGYCEEYSVYKIDVRN